MDPFDKFSRFTRAREAEAIGAYPYFIPMQSEAGPEVTMNGRPMLMFGSNNYLGLTQHPRVKEAALRAVERYGTSCTGSRYMNGTLDLHLELEARLARFLGKEAALVFTTGFQTNLGVISAIVGRHDVAVIDRTDHASIIDGCRLSFGETARFRHNDMAQLEEILERHHGKRGLVIIVEGVFSMEGDLADLPAIVRLRERYGARLILDDAHGLGVMGATGAGTAEHFGVADQVDLIVGTFSKSLASTGGFVAGSADALYYIRHHARSMQFAAATPPASAAAALAALDVLEGEPQRRERLWENVRRHRAGLEAAGLDTGRTASQIVPVICGEDMQVVFMWKACFDAGLYTNPSVSPAVEPGRGLLRTSCMATHTADHIDRAVAILAGASQKLGIAGPARADLTPLSR